MRLKHLLLFSTCILAVVSCGDDGKNNSADPKNLDNTPIVQPAPEFNINQGWHPVSKRCGDSNSELQQLESYRLNDVYFVKIQMLSETSSLLCKVGFVYEHTVTSSSHTDGIYSETAVLRPAMTKKTCWKKLDNQLTDVVVSDDVFEMGGENMSLKMTYTNSAATGQQLGLTLLQSKECPEKDLHMVLNK